MVGSDRGEDAQHRPGVGWEKGYNESFNGLLHDELLGGEIVYSLAEAKLLIEAWRRHYNTIRPSQQPRLPPPGTRNSFSAIVSFRFRFAPPAVGHGAGGNLTLTNNRTTRWGPITNSDVVPSQALGVSPPLEDAGRHGQDWLLAVKGLDL
jgi:hypothetical protein